MFKIQLAYGLWNTNAQLHSWASSGPCLALHIMFQGRPQRFLCFCSHVLVLHQVSDTEQRFVAGKSEGEAGAVPGGPL